MSAAPAFRPPALHLDAETGTAVLSGDWVFATVAAQQRQLARQLAAVPAGAGWDLSGIERFDSGAAVLLWQAWGGRWPAPLAARAAHRTLLQELAAAPPLPPEPVEAAWLAPVRFTGRITLGLAGLARDGLLLFGRLWLATGYLLLHPRDFPWRELSANLFKVGVMALGITALVGTLIGIVLSFLSAQQLARYGANVLIVDLLGISILRELGPLLAAILVAGRSGSAITAQLGVMKINQELDAMSALGLSPTLRLAFPKVLALVIAMPLLALWTDVLALAGGMLSALWELKLPPSQFLDRFPTAVPLRHLWIGLAKSVVFGGLIGVIACQCGFGVASNSESLGAATTRSVVSSITLVILVDALFATLLAMQRI